LTVERTITARIITVGECMKRLSKNLLQDHRAKILKGAPTKPVQLVVNEGHNPIIA
jgi:hypothetical protein